MTSHKTGTREEWLAARLELLEAEKELTRRRRRASPAAAGAALGPGRQGLPLRDRRGHGVARRPVRGDARSCSSTTSCSAPTTPPGARPARRSPTASTAPRSTSPTTTSRSARSRGPRSPNCTRTSGGWAGASRGRPRTAATSTSTSGWRTPRRSGKREPSPTTSARRTCGRRPAKEDSLDAFSESIVGTDWQTYRREGPGMSAFALQDGDRLPHLLGVRRRTLRPARSIKCGTYQGVHSALPAPEAAGQLPPAARAIPGPRQRVAVAAMSLQRGFPPPRRSCAPSR